MKKVVLLLLALMLVTCTVTVTAEETIKGKIKADWNVSNKSELFELNPVIEGESPYTGLPSSGETFTPILMVLDNAGPDDNGNPTAYPHWGVEDADIIFQVPNSGVAATKLLALFADKYPEAAGGIRSGRTGFYPVAKMFDAAFAFFGFPGIQDKSGADLENLLKKDGEMLKNKKWFNMIGGTYTERVNNRSNPHNASLHVKALHEHLEELVNNGEVAFEKRAFEFADEPRTVGTNAEYIEIIHKGTKKNGKSNPASYATFTYVPEKNGYIRTNSSGDYIDANGSGEAIIFTNVIVLRTGFNTKGEYVWAKGNMRDTNGTAEIFQNGKYVRGVWSRNKQNSSRLLLTEKIDGNVCELQMQRGKTFIVITNDVTDIVLK